MSRTCLPHHGTFQLSDGCLAYTQSVCQAAIWNCQTQFGPVFQCHTSQGTMPQNAVAPYATPKKKPSVDEALLDTGRIAPARKLVVQVAISCRLGAQNEIIKGPK